MGVLGLAVDNDADRAVVAVVDQNKNHRADKVCGSCRLRSATSILPPRPVRHRPPAAACRGCCTGWLELPRMPSKRLVMFDSPSFRRVGQWPQGVSPQEIQCLMIQRALLSVTDKTGIVGFAQALSALNVEILSTGGTFRVLKDAGVSPLGKEVAEVTQFPEMLDGRVKTLHPARLSGIPGHALPSRSTCSLWRRTASPPSISSP